MIKSRLYLVLVTVGIILLSRISSPEDRNWGLSLWNSQNEGSSKVETLINLTERLKEKGNIVDCFKLLQKEDIVKISGQTVSFYKNELSLLKITNRVHISIKNLSTNSTIEKTIQEFLKEWEGGYIVAPILINTWCEQGEEGEVFYIIYSYHDEDFLRIKKAMDFIFNLSNNKEVCYIDELGLIPYESIEREKKYKNISEEEAFNEIKSMLQNELKRIKEGYTLYDPEPTYSKIYSYLAQRKIECYMEDLQYENWKRIVQFDELKISKIAQLYFLNGDVDNYLKYKKTYIKGFWQLNVNIRDRIFADQVEKLIKDNPEKVFFTIRGIGHLGLIKKLTSKGIKVRYIILGEKDLQTSLINQQVLQICYDLGIKLLPDDETLLLLQAEIQELLRAYIGYFEKKHTLKSTVQANEMIRKLDLDDIYSIFSQTHIAIKEKKVKVKYIPDIYKLIYNLVQEAVKKIEK